MLRTVQLQLEIEQNICLSSKEGKLGMFVLCSCETLMSALSLTKGNVVLGSLVEQSESRVKITLDVQASGGGRRREAKLCGESLRCHVI